MRIKRALKHIVVHGSGPTKGIEFCLTCGTPKCLLEAMLKSKPVRTTKKFKTYKPSVKLRKILDPDNWKRLTYIDVPIRKQ